MFIIHLAVAISTLKVTLQPFSRFVILGRRGIYFETTTLRSELQFGWRCRPLDDTSDAVDNEEVSGNTIGRQHWLAVTNVERWRRGDACVAEVSDRGRPPLSESIAPSSSQYGR